jgi:ribosomal protein L35
MPGSFRVGTGLKSEATMAKMKTRKGPKKRFHVTARGKVGHRKPNAGHLMSHKSGDRCRKLRQTGYLSGAIARRVLIALGEA